MEGYDESRRDEPGSDDNLDDEVRDRVQRDPADEPERVEAHPEDDPTAVEPGEAEEEGGTGVGEHDDGEDEGEAAPA
jgi:hypothetical protein